jgi:hypothetical protein
VETIRILATFAAGSHYSYELSFQNCFHFWLVGLHFKQATRVVTEGNDMVGGQLNVVAAVERAIVTTADLPSFTEQAKLRQAVATVLAEQH